MIDTHAHLNFETYVKDFDNIVRHYSEKGGEELLVVGANIDSSLKAVELAQKYPNCYASIGIHPHHIDLITSFNQTLSVLTDISLNKKVVAIGETGIDYHQYKNGPLITSDQKAKQKELFLTHIEVALKRKLPLIIHCRDAQDDLIAFLGKYQKINQIRGVLHCFDGNKNYLEKILAMGFFIGFDGNITYPENQRLREFIKFTPLNRLLVETDSPYLTPVPLRKQRNEPANLVYIISQISEIKNLSYQEIEKQTSENARTLFRLNKTSN